MNDTSEVKLHFLDYWRTIKVRAGLVVLTFLLVMVTAGVTTYFLPREFYSKVKLEVKPDKAVIDVFGSGNRGYTDPMFVPTQFQVLQTKEILYPVIESLKLVDTWSAAEGGGKMSQERAYLKLLRMMDLKEVRNTGLIEIGIYSTDAQEAANIANSIAVVYREKRLSDMQQNIDRALAQLRDEVDKQQQVVRDSMMETTRIRERDGIVDSDPESLTNGLVTTQDRNIVQIEKDLNDKRLRVNQLKGQFEAIMKMKPEELRDVLRTLNIDDQNVVKQVQTLQDATAEEAKAIAAGLGENHPRLKSIRSAKEVYLNNLSDQLASVRKSQASLMEIEQRVLSDLEERFKQSQTTQIEDKKKSNAYLDSKTKYIQDKKIFEAAQIKYSTEKFERAIDFEPAKIWERAERSSYWAKPNVAAYMVLAAMVGLISGIGLAFFIEYLDTSVKTLDDVEKHLQVPVLAVVPKNVHTLMNTPGDTADAEVYRILRANVEFKKPNRNANTITLVSGGPGEGKSTTLNNLAFVCAQGGYHVLVIDADLRRPSQHRIFDVENKFGLVDYLKGEASIDEITKATKLDNLSFIPSGRLPESSVGILNSQRMVELIAQVKTQYDLVFFDAPPILGVSDGSVLSSECDITIMVVQHRRFPRAMLQRVKQAVQQAGGTLIGVVLNNVDTKSDEGYSYYSNDYYSKPVREAAKPKATAPAPRRQARSAPESAPAHVPVPAVKNGDIDSGIKPRAVDDEDY